MSFMGKNINLFLLILVIGVVILLAGASLFFQENLKNINKNLKEERSNLNLCKTELISKINALNQTLENLNFTKQDISKYGVLYQNKTVELETTQSELSEKSEQLSSATTQLTSTKTELADVKAKYTSENILRQELELEVGSLSQELKSVTSAKAAADAKIEDLKDDISSLQSQLDACQTPAE